MTTRQYGDVFYRDSFSTLFFSTVGAMTPAYRFRF